MDAGPAKKHRGGIQGRKILLGSRAEAVAAICRRLPALEGDPIRIEWRSELRRAGRRLISGPGRGMAVHAASFLRRRRIVFDRALLADQRELARIVVHELFHFVWVRLSNAQRASWSGVLAAQRTAGELGWSADWRKQALRECGAVGPTSRAWREYACESFCDTAAWLYSGVSRHEEFSLPGAERAVRRGWFAALLRHRGGRFRI